MTLVYKYAAQPLHPGVQLALQGLGERRQPGAGQGLASTLKQAR